MAWTDRQYLSCSTSTRPWGRTAFALTYFMLAHSLFSSLLRKQSQHLSQRRILLHAGASELTGFAWSQTLLFFFLFLHMIFSFQTVLISQLNQITAFLNNYGPTVTGTPRGQYSHRISITSFVTAMQPEVPPPWSPCISIAPPKGVFQGGCTPALFASRMA